jgi:ureidoacrylate peracid hydrolase
MTGLLRSFEEQVQPAHTAVLVIDMQNDFCAEGGYLQKERGYDVGFARAVAASIAQVAAAARASGTPIVWIRSVYDFKYLASPHKVKRGAEGCCMEGTWGADFFVLKPAPDELIVTKHHFSAFHGTPLDNLLRTRGIRTLAITGVATNVCVDSTLRDAFFLGYHIVVVEDCVGSNSKVGHEGTLATVRNNIGTVVVSSHLIERLRCERSRS